jgi:hypothetical protein
MAGVLVTGHRRSLTCFVLLALLAAGSCGSGLTNSDAAASSDAIDADAQAPNVGSTCDILTDAGPNQGVFNMEALECASRICIKPIVQPNATGPSSTTALCTAPCTQDSDCFGQSRDLTNPLDSRCATGFACGIAFTKGRMCCQKVCMCRDFLGASGPLTPIACQGDAAANCFQ